MAATHLVFVGLMGSGKSTVSRRVAQRLGWPVVDLDELVEAEAGCSIAELFASRGEVAFRDLESQVLETVLHDPRPSVVATGGGVVVRPHNRRLLGHNSRARVVWLDATPEVLARRVSGGTTVRPLLADDPLGALRRLDAERRPLYREVAHHRLDTDVPSLDAVVDAVVTWWRTSSSPLTLEESP